MLLLAINTGYKFGNNLTSLSRMQPQHILSSRQASWQAATQQVFDIVIIGGGATGAGAALDAASRGYRVLLVEADDFGSATSSKSTKLIHGGVRYLEQAVKKLSYQQYRMVRKALHERATLLQLAPHITRPLQLITPCRTWLEGVYYYIGLKLYDVISGRTHLGKSQLLTRQQALEKLPTLRRQQLYTAVLYYDGQLDDLRYNWALAHTAAAEGATCFNHTAVTSFEKDAQGRLSGAWLHDRYLQQSFFVRGRCFINATGPFADGIRQLAQPTLAPRIRVSKGVHILLPKHMMPGASALLIPQTKDGRLVFAIPYQKHVLVGTTDEEAELTAEEFGPTRADVQYLLEYCNAYLDINAGEADVKAGFGGLRPLVKKLGGHTKDLVRDHEIETDPQSGLISILGGKWTTYRLMARDGVDAAGQQLHDVRPCRTQQLVLLGSRQYSHHTAIALQQHSGWDHEIVKHLVSKYGDQSMLVAQLAQQQPSLAQRILPGMPYTWAELQYNLQYEMALTVKDVIARRWGTQLADWQQALQLIAPVGQYMAQQLGWSHAQQTEYIDGYQQQLAQLIAQSK